MGSRIHFSFLYLKGQSEKSATQIDDLIVYALGTPLVIIAFFIPLCFTIENALIVYPEYACLAGSSLMFAGYVFVITWIIASFVEGILHTYGATLAATTESDVDDRILINDITGDVIHIGPRSTRIVTLDSDIVTIPNSKVTTSIIRNFSQPEATEKIRILISIIPDTEVSRIKDILARVAADA